MLLTLPTPALQLVNDLAKEDMNMSTKQRWLNAIETVSLTVFFGLVANWISSGFRLPHSASVVFVIIGVASLCTSAVRVIPPLLRRSTVVTNGWSVSPRSALICTISDRQGASDEVVPVIVQQLRKSSPITCLGLIGTPETQAAGTKAKIMESLGNAQPQQVKEIACNPFDLTDAQVTTQNLLDWATRTCGLSNRQILVDVTGGTAVMTLGAYLAAQDADVDVEYVATPRSTGQKADMQARYPVIISRGRKGMAQLQQRATDEPK
jgi:hypothetical protein